MENRTQADIIIGCFQLDLNMYTNIQGKAIHKNVHSGYLWQWEQVALFPIYLYDAPKRIQDSLQIDKEN